MAKSKTTNVILFKEKPRKKLRRHSKKKTPNKGSLNYCKPYAKQGR